MKLIVIDPKTSEYPDLEKYKDQDWYTFDHRLRLDGFSIDEDGCLLLSDRCGNSIYVPAGIFEVRLDCKVAGSNMEHTASKQ